jgi:transcriptional regulator with XRE-family HTH domain
MTREERFIKKFGENLQRLRKQKGWTQDDLSGATDIPRSQIGRIEKGTVNTTLKTMLRISKALNIDVRVLFDFEETK